MRSSNSAYSFTYYTRWKLASEFILNFYVDGISVSYNKNIYKQTHSLYIECLVMLFNLNTIDSKYTLNSLSTPTGGADRVSGGAIIPPSTPLAPPLPLNKTFYFLRFFYSPYVILFHLMLFYFPLGPFVSP